MNGTAGGGGGLAEDEEMPVQHELGEELAFTGRQAARAAWQTAVRFTLNTSRLWEFEYVLIKIWQNGKVI